MGFKQPSEIAKGMVEIGIKKANLTADKMIILGFLAGAYIGLGGFLAIRVSGSISSDIWGSLQKLVFGAVFPVGLMLVIIAGAELVTGNFMTQTISFVDGKITLKGVLKNWLLVYIGNLLGSLFIAFVLAYKTGLIMETVKLANASLDLPWASYIVKIANAKVSLSWWEAFWRGVGCNWLVALAVWIAFAAEDIVGKIFAIWWPIMAFVSIGFEHSVANMFFIPLGIFAGNDVKYINLVQIAKVPALKATWESFIVNNLIPVTLGNIVGAGLFVGVVYWYVYLQKKD